MFDRQQLIEALKAHAKRMHRAYRMDCPSAFAIQLSSFQNDIAKRFGYENWSLLHRAVKIADDYRYELISEKAHELGLSSFHLNGDNAVHKMREWVKNHFTPLIRFAFYDRESENGFDMDSEDIYANLADEFSDIYPDPIIKKIAKELEFESGPWGREIRE